MGQKKNTFEKIGFRFAWKGILTTVAQEYNLKIHLIVAALVVVTGLILEVSLTEWLFLVVAIMSVLVAELFNTAIETLCDIVSTKQEPSIGFVKDVAAGAVLVAAIFATIIGVIIFVPKVVHFY